MIKDILKKTFLYSIYANIKIKKQRQLCLLEIQNRLANNSLLKDIEGEDLVNWNYRIQTVLASEDNQKIVCINDAGTLRNGLLVMHNGIVIEPLSYYGFPILKMLLENRGIHEPQEEYVFQEILKNMPDGATMIELGAYWSFYSMWFNMEVKNANNYMIEPTNLSSGTANFKLNKLKGKFFKYYIADKPGVHEDGTKIISVDSFVKDNKVDFVDILHSDIQGEELLMLKGANDLLTKGNVGYVFISTHSDELHADCAKFMDEIGYIKVCSANLQETYSWDGLLVYKNPEYSGIDKLEISLKKRKEQISN